MRKLKIITTDGKEFYNMDDAEDHQTFLDEAEKDNIRQDFEHLEDVRMGAADILYIVEYIFDNYVEV